MLCWFLPCSNVNQPWYTYVPSFSNLPPTPPITTLQVVTEHRVELPVLYGNFPLATDFMCDSKHLAENMELAFLEDTLEDSLTQ